MTRIKLNKTKPSHSVLSQTYSQTQTLKKNAESTLTKYHVRQLFHDSCSHLKYLCFFAQDLNSFLKGLWTSYHSAVCCRRIVINLPQLGLTVQHLKLGWEDIQKQMTLMNSSYVNATDKCHLYVFMQIYMHMYKACK